MITRLLKEKDEALAREPPTGPDRPEHHLDPQATAFCAVPGRGDMTLYGIVRGPFDLLERLW